MNVKRGKVKGKSQPGVKMSTVDKYARISVASKVKVKVLEERVTKKITTPRDQNM